jgi:hypothetical protein
MTLLTPGTICPLCSRTIDAGEEVIGFSAFVANRLDPLYLFHDAAFHRDCFDKDPRSAAVLQRYEEVRCHGGPGNRQCVVCRQEVLDPQDAFSTSFLTDDPASPVFPYNYVFLHRSHFAQWTQAEDFRRCIEAFQSSPAWDGVRVVFEPFLSWKWQPESRRVSPHQTARPFEKGAE